MSVSCRTFILTIGLAIAGPRPSFAETHDGDPEAEPAISGVATENESRKGASLGSAGPGGAEHSSSPAGRLRPGTLLLGLVAAVVAAFLAYLFLVRPQRALSRSASRLMIFLRIRSVGRVLEQFFAEEQRLSQMDQRYQERKHEFERMRSVAEMHEDQELAAALPGFEDALIRLTKAKREWQSALSTARKAFLDAMEDDETHQSEWAPKIRAELRELVRVMRSGSARSLDSIVPPEEDDCALASIVTKSLHRGPIVVGKEDAEALPHYLSQEPNSAAAIREVYQRGGAPGGTGGWAENLAKACGKLTKRLRKVSRDLEQASSSDSLPVMNLERSLLSHMRDLMSIDSGIRETVFSRDEELEEKTRTVMREAGRRDTNG